MILFNEDNENNDELEIEGTISVNQVLEERNEPQVDLKKEVDSLLEQLNEIEQSLGMQVDFDDIEFPEPKSIDLPPVQYPQPVFTQVDFAKLDDEQLDLIMRQFKKIDTMEAELKAIKEVIDERLNVDFRAMYENIMEKTNIEAIKTYRNVQAVIIEENAKQNQALFGIDNKSNSLKKRMNNVLIFAIVSFVVSILVMLVTILPALGINLF